MATIGFIKGSKPYLVDMTSPIKIASIIFAICLSCEDDKKQASMDDAYDLIDSLCQKQFDCETDFNHNECVDQFTQSAETSNENSCLDVFIDWASCLNKDMRCVDGYFDGTGACDDLEIEALDCFDQ
jgi:hypothetical protein